jgi:ubiquinone/menaquinone biosynthesis C-methylase UbiE
MRVRWGDAHSSHQHPPTTGFPFQDNSFSFVFLRFFTLSVPMGGWEAFLAECLRILEPGGYIEVHGSDYLMRRCGEYGERLNGAVEEISRLVGVDLADARSLQRPLAIAGFEEVGRRVSSMPMGTWGGRLGEWSLEATRLHVETTALPLMQRFLSPDRIEGLEGSTLGFFFETDDYRSYVNLYAYLGRKPIGEISPGSSLCG